MTPNAPSSVTHCWSASKSPSTSIVVAVVAVVAPLGMPSSDDEHGCGVPAAVAGGVLPAADDIDAAPAADCCSSLVLQLVSSTTHSAAAANGLPRQMAFPVELITPASLLPHKQRKPRL